MDPVQFTGPSSLDVENLLPQSLRDGMLPIQHENLQLLVSLIQTRLSSRQLKWHNEQLSAEMEQIKGGSSSPTDPTAAEVEDRMDGLEDALKLCVAELIALIVSWQRQMEGEQRKDLSVEYERCRMEMQDLAIHQEKEVESLMERLAPSRIRDRFSGKCHANEVTELRKSLELRQKRSLEETMAALEQEEVVLAESCMALDDEESKMQSEMQVESEEAEALRRMRLEVGKLETLRNRLEASEQTALSNRRKSHQECVFWEDRIQHYARVREELTDSAWVMSHELQEKILETEAAADDLKMLRPLETPKGNPELQEEETAIRLQLARAEKALAPKQREVAEALNESFELRKALTSAYNNRSAAKIAEAEAAREVRSSRRRNAGLRESLKKQLTSVAELKESKREVEAKDRKVLLLQRRALHEELADTESNALAEELRVKTSELQLEAQTARRLRVDIRDVRAKQQHRLRQRSKTVGSVSSAPLALENSVPSSISSADVQKQLRKREQQLQLLRTSLSSVRHLGGKTERP